MTPGKRSKLESDDEVCNLSPVYTHSIVSVAWVWLDNQRTNY